MQTNNDNDENDDYSDGEDRVPSENTANTEAALEGKVGDTVLGVSENPPSRPSYSSTNNEEATNKRLSTNSRRSMVDKTTDQIIIDNETAITNYHDDDQSADIEMAIPSYFFSNNDNDNIDSLQLSSNGYSITKTFIEDVAVEWGIEEVNDLEDVSISPLDTSAVSPPQSQSTPGGDDDGNLKVAMMECQCCYVETELEDMVSCREKGHLFCQTCLRKYVEERVFGLGNLGITTSTTFEISCLHSSGCTSGFPKGQMQRVLPEKVMTK
mmetsp:Transcript_18977/g.39807  ORF Transcript_18977/g.39807 Transcript_18977/m.39807 type:complete len:268 (-) Transcript_18977:722-1525(-)